MTSPPLTCACKGIRFCAVCKDSERIQKYKNLTDSNNEFNDYQTYVFNPMDQRCYSSSNISTQSSVDEIMKHSQWLQQQPANIRSNIESFQMGGLLVIENFLSEDEEEQLVKDIELTPWALSQSGRRKQVRFFYFGLQLFYIYSTLLGLWSSCKLQTSKS